MTFYEAAKTWRADDASLGKIKVQKVSHRVEIRYRAHAWHDRNCRSWSLIPPVLFPAVRRDQTGNLLHIRSPAMQFIHQKQKNHLIQYRSFLIKWVLVRKHRNGKQGRLHHSPFKIRHHPCLFICLFEWDIEFTCVKLVQRKYRWLMCNGLSHLSVCVLNRKNLSRFSRIKLH